MGIWPRVRLKLSGWSRGTPSDMHAGDRVYLWRNQGSQNAVPGVIAEAIIMVPPELRGEDHERRTVLARGRPSVERSTGPSDHAASQGRNEARGASE